MRCPKLYDYVYNKGGTRERTQMMRGGTVIHSALEVLNKHAMEEAKKPVDRRILIGTEDVEKAFNDALARDTVPGELSARNVQVLYDSLEYYAEGIMDNADRIIAVEELIPIEYRPDLWLVIKPDRIDQWEDGHEITDYKSGDNILSKAELLEDTQLCTYAYADLQINPQVERFKLTQHMLKYKFANSVVVEAKDVTHVKKFLDNVIRGMEEKRYEPRMNPECHFCPVRSRCSAYKKRFTMHHERPSGIHKAHQELKVLVATISTMTGRKEDLRDYIGEKCNRSAEFLRVEKGLMAWGFYPTESEVREIAAVAKLFREYGLDITPLLSITKDAMDEAKRQLYNTTPQNKIDEFKKEFKKLAKRKVMTRLDCRKVK